MLKTTIQNRKTIYIKNEIKNMVKKHDKNEPVNGCNRMRLSKFIKHNLRRRLIEKLHGNILKHLNMSGITFCLKIRYDHWSL